MMIKKITDVVSKKLIALTLVLSVLIGIIDGSIAIILTNITFEDAKMSMGNSDIILFGARFLSLLVLTNIFSKCLAKIQLSIDTKVFTKFEDASHDQLMQYSSNISANVVYVGLVALLTLIADISMISVLLVILIKTSLPSTLILLFCFIFIITPVGLYVFSKAKLATRAKAQAEKDKLKDIRFVKDNWYSLEISAPSKNVRDQLYHTFTNWADANSSVLFYGRTLRFTFESAMLCVCMVGFYIISFVEIAVPTEFILAVAVTGVKAVPLAFRAGKSIMLINNMTVYINQLLEIFGVKPKRRFYSDTYLQNIVEQLQYRRVNVIRGKSGAGKTTIITELGTYLKRNGHNVSFSQQFPTILDHNLTNDTHYFGVPLQDVSVISAQLGLDLAKNLKGPYSGGQLKRIGIAIALAHQKSDYIILDEPDSGLSDDDLSLLWEVLDRVSKTTYVLCVTHKPNLRALDYEIKAH